MPENKHSFAAVTGSQGGAIKHSPRTIIPHLGLEQVGTRIRAEGGEAGPSPRIYTWIEGFPGPPTLHNWQPRERI